MLFVDIMQHRVSQIVLRDGKSGFVRKRQNFFTRDICVIILHEFQIIYSKISPRSTVICCYDMLICYTCFSSPVCLLVLSSFCPPIAEFDGYLV
jgi:hypothetical protein